MLYILNNWEQEFKVQNNCYEYGVNNTTLYNWKAEFNGLCVNWSDIMAIAQTVKRPFPYKSS